MDPVKRLDGLIPLIGKTPLLEIDFMFDGERKKIFAKAEYFNITGSIKDRVAYYIIKKGYESGTLSAGDIIAEATSGNTGISFCALGRAMGHKVVIHMPDWMSSERVNLMKSFGAEVVMVSREEGGFLGAIAKTEELGTKCGYFLPRQFSNEDNTSAHYETTGAEIVAQLEQLGLKAGVFVAGVGTGGTVMGVGARLRKANPACRVHPLEPESSPTLSTGFCVGSHRIQGISDEFIPELLRLKELSPIVTVDDGDAIMMARMLSQRFGLGVGISSGANFLGLIAAGEGGGASVTVFPDDNKKYLSTDYCDFEKVAMQEKYLSRRVELVCCKAYRC